MSVLPHRESTLSSKRSSWDLSEVIDLTTSHMSCALWEALEFPSGPLVMSHVRAKGLEEHNLPSDNIPPRRQLLPLHLTDYKPGV